MTHPIVQARFRNSVSNAFKKFEETSKLEHAGLKGRFREIFFTDIIRPVLSNEFIAGSGLVIDHLGGTSREADVVIFDKFHIPAVLYKDSEG